MWLAFSLTRYVIWTRRRVKREVFRDDAFGLVTNSPGNPRMGLVFARERGHLSLA